MKNNQRADRILWISAWGILVVCIYLFQYYRLWSWESNHLFLYDGAYCSDALSQTGGLALLIASFISQLFHTPFIALLCMAGIYFLIIRSLSGAYRCVGTTSGWMGWMFVPIGFLFLCVENDYYRLQGHIAFLISVASLWGYLSYMPSSYVLRSTTGLLATILLYHAAGPMAWMFAIGAWIADCSMYGKRGMTSILYPLMMLVAGYASHHWAWVETLEKAFLPALYYDTDVTYFFPTYAEASFIIMFLFWAVFGKSAWMKRAQWLVSLSGAVGAFGCTCYMFHAIHSDSGYKIIKEQYYTECEEWQKIVDMSDEMTRNYYICYLHLALAQQGVLPDRIPYYRVFDESHLSTPSPVLKHRHALLSKAYYYMGDADAAFLSAKESNESTPGACNPYQLKILVQTSLAKGDYRSAERYIGLLEKTLFYDDWAREQRRFLNNPDWMKQDEVLNGLYLSTTIRHAEPSKDRLKQRMKNLLDVNPSNKVLHQLYVAYLMLGHGG